MACSLLEVAKHSGDRWSGARLDLLDRQPIVDDATLAAYAATGWQARSLIADVMDGRRRRRRALDETIVVANLFLHHFDAESLRRLLSACARRADAIAACEPRSRFALAASHLIFFLGANAVTRNDGVLSVRAGFVGDELGAAWPDPAGEWRVDEYDDGLFTHCLVASRRRRLP